jgi:hypothetical protein
VLHFRCAGYRSAMTMLAVALLTIVAVSFHFRRATPILPIAIDRPASSHPRSPAEKAANLPRQKTGSVQIPIAPDAPPRHILRGFLVWAFVKTRRFNGRQVGASLPSSVSWFDLRAVSSSRPTLRSRWRAQKLSRLAVAPTLRQAPPSPGHTLTASSTTARLVRSG